MVFSGPWGPMALTFVAQVSILSVWVWVSVSVASFVSADLIVVGNGADVEVAAALLVLVVAAAVEKIFLLILMMTPSNDRSLLECQESDFQSGEKTKNLTAI